MKFELEPYHRNVPNQVLLNDLIRVSRKLGKDRVTIDEYNEHGDFHSTTLTRRFGPWLTVLLKAGLKKTRNLNITNEELFKNLVEVRVSRGRQPKYNDPTKDVSKYSLGTYEDRFGGWRKALEAFVKWTNEEAQPTRNTCNSQPRPKRRTSRKINWRLPALVLMRDGARCRLCGATPQNGARLDVDPIQPWNKGGETVLENLQILCVPCNIGKSDITTVNQG